MAKEAAKQGDGNGGSKTKLFIIIAVIVVLLIGGGIGAFLFLKGDDNGAPQESQVETAAQAQVGPMVNIESFIVNILDDEQSRYLKAAITIEVDSEPASVELNQRMPQVKDAILLLIGNKTFSELSDLQGKIQLRAELINKLNSILVKGKVKRIYFTDFVVQ